MYWLLSDDVRKAMDNAVEAGLKPTAQQQQEYAAAYKSDIAAKAGATAEIQIKGILTKSPDLFATLFGGGNTTYSGIVSAIAEAEADPEVSEIVLRVDSPGGTMAGLFDAIAAIQAAKKPVKAVVEDMAASAAYGLVSQADTIVANNKAAQIGSVGVVVTYVACEGMVSVTSTNAPKKRPDVTTDEGKAIVREELDALHALFVEAIAEGRGTTVEKINESYGQGAILLAEQALSRGMIDAIAGYQEKKEKTSANAGGTNPEDLMDLKTFMAQHPEAYAEAVQAGVDQERDRITAHLNLAEGSGDMKSAVEAIKTGSAVTQSVYSHHMAFAMNRKDQENRDDDEQAAAAAADGADNSNDQDGMDEQVAAIVEAKLGLGEAV